MKKFIYIVCPWGSVGGGMFKIADYLIQNQNYCDGKIKLRELDSRGNGAVLWSPFVLLCAIARVIVYGMLGNLVGMHVNVAERLSLFRKGLIIICARLVNVPVILHLHAAQLSKMYYGLPAWLQKLVKEMFGMANRCVVLGGNARMFVINELGVESSRVVTIVNGVPRPEDKVQLRKNDDFNILFVGNLLERKGVNDLLEALSFLKTNIKKWHAKFAGGGDIKRYKELSKALGLSDKVDFIGWVDQAKIGDLLHEADILVLPSYDEGLPLVILEALSHGVAVLCTPVGEIPEFLSHGETAYFVNPGDRYGIAEAIQELAMNDALRTTLENSGREVYDKIFSFEAFRSHVYDLYKECFEKRI